MATAAWTPVDESVPNSSTTAPTSGTSTGSSSGWEPVQEQPAAPKKSLLDHWAEDPNPVPMDSFWHTQQHIAHGIGQGVAQAAKGAIDTFKAPQNTEEKVGGALVPLPAYRMAKGAVQTVGEAAKLPGVLYGIAKESPNPIDTILKGASDTAEQGAGQAVAALATEGLSKGLKAGVKALPSEAKTASTIRAAVPEAATLPDKAVASGDKVFRAIAPVATDAGARANLHVASGDLAEIGKKVDWDSTRGGINSPDMRPRAVLDATNDHMKSMYENERASQIAKAPNAPVEVTANRNAVRGLDYMTKGAGDIAIQELAEKAIKTNGKLSLAETDALAREVNAELYKYESLPPEQQAAIRNTNPNINGLKELDQALTKTIDGELEAQGQPGIKNYERRYAALSNVRRDLAKRVNAAELDQPGLVKNTLRQIPGKGVKNIASASAAATADVRVGDMLEKGMKGLGESGVKPVLDQPRNPAPFNLTPSGKLPPPEQGKFAFAGGPGPEGGVPNTVGTAAGAANDTTAFQQAKSELGSKASVSDVAKRAQEIKDQRAPQNPQRSTTRTIEPLPPVQNIRTGGGTVHDPDIMASINRDVARHAGMSDVLQNAQGQGGHAGGGVASVEELSRPGQNYIVSKDGKLTYHGKPFAPESTPKGSTHVTVRPNGDLIVNEGPELNAKQKEALKIATKKPSTSYPGRMKSMKATLGGS